VGTARTAPIPDAVDPNCEGSVKARQAAEELALLKSFALELKGMTDGPPTPAPRTRFVRF
jgi:hypothetical protein